MYEGWAAVYDAWMTDIDYEGWVRMAHEAMQRLCPEGKTAVDLACGTGNVSLPLMEMGYQVCGLDGSADMLNLATRKARQRGLAIPFVRQDLRSFQLHRPVDLAVCAIDGINYLTDLKDVEKFFCRVHENLRPGGVFVFDISSAYKLEHILANQFYGWDEDEGACLWFNEYDSENRILTLELLFLIKEGELYRKVPETQRQRAHKVEELVPRLREAGFSSVEIYGDGQRAPEADEERIYFIAQRM